MKKIRFVDVGNNGIIRKFISNILQEYRIDEVSMPEYLICGDFITYEFLKYDAIKIYISGENEYPNWNLYDYAIGLMHVENKERYLRWPFYLWRDGTRYEFELACKKHTFPIKKKSKFCNFIVSNGFNADSYRTKLFEKLNKYKKVDSAGKYLNNMGFYVQNKLEFIADYKFTIACENSSSKGYITEKIVEAWAAGTIPIYWGAPDIAEEFNEKAFINCMKYQSIDEVIEVIKYIDENDDVYEEMLKQPILSEHSRANNFVDDTLIKEFFNNIFNQPLEKAKKISRTARVACIYSEIERLKKAEQYYLMMDKWKKLTESGKRICEHKIFKNASFVVVYGLGIIGKLLIDELLKEKIQIQFIIDNYTESKEYRGISIYPFNEIKQLDILIMTVEDITGKLNKEIATKIPRVNIVNLSNILNEL